MWELQQKQNLQGMETPLPLGMKILEFLTFIDVFSEHFLKVFCVIYLIINTYFFVNKKIGGL